MSGNMEKTVLRALIAFLLLFNGAGAIYGGGSFILHPDGSGLMMSGEWLKHSPFNDFLIPGIILFVCNGLLSFVALFVLFTKYERAWMLVAGQGTILCGWIFVQLLMLRYVVTLHVVMMSVGVLLILCGFIYKRLSETLMILKRTA